MREYTPKRQEIMCFIRKHILEHGYPPSTREIGKSVGLSSTSTVWTHLKALEDLCLVKITPGVERGLRVIDGSIVIKEA